MKPALLVANLSTINGFENKIFRKRNKFLRRITKFVENNLLKILAVSFSGLIVKEIGLALYKYLWQLGHIH